MEKYFTIEKTIDIVSQVYDLHRRELLSKEKRSRRIARARYALMFYLVEQGYSRNEISQLLEKDASSVSQGIKAHLKTIKIFPNGIEAARDSQAREALGFSGDWSYKTLDSTTEDTEDSSSLCGTAGCGRPAEKAGLCSSHYREHVYMPKKN